MGASFRTFVRSAAAVTVATLSTWSADVPASAAEHEESGRAAGPKPWCAPEVTELSDHVCYFDGRGPRTDGRQTLVIYLHGSLAATPGFQYLQQRTLALQAKHLGLTVLLPTAPRTESGYWWPSGAAQKEQEPVILAGLREARAKLEERLGTHFDETFVVGFSSGAYYASSLALRSALDVDGYIVLAGGSSWARPSDAAAKRAPVFVGVSASDRQTADHSRAFAGTLAALRWPYRVEERPVGHLVDPTFLAHGLSWLRARARAGVTAPSVAP